MHRRFFWVWFWLLYASVASVCSAWLIATQDNSTIDYVIDIVGPIIWWVIFAIELGKRKRENV